MCVMSAMFDGAYKVPQQQWTQPAYDQFQQIIALIAQLDEKLGQADCEDPSKAAWMREVEARLKKLETKPTTPVKYAGVSTQSPLNQQIENILNQTQGRKG